MAWEEIAGQVSGGMFLPLGDDEISIVQTTVRNSKINRVNIPRKLIPMDVTMVTLKIDKERKRIGFFKVTNAENARKLNPYGKKNRMVFVSVPRVIKEIGFDKGRYKIKTDKEAPDMFFMVRVRDLVARFPSKEDLIKQTEEKMKNE